MDGYKRIPDISKYIESLREKTFWAEEIYNRLETNLIETSPEKAITSVLEERLQECIPNPNTQQVFLKHS